MTNFVFILADDLGHADLGCYGGRVPVSPALDRMAAQGLRFSSAYANSPVCSPTRFALATGRYQCREDVLLEALQSLAEREQTLADIERGLEDEAFGRVREASTAFAQLRAKYQIPVTP